MKKIITLLTVLALIIIACQHGKESSLLLKPDDYPADEYVINIDKDTTLITKNGALLKIPKGALSTDKGNTVTLEIKEAYSIEQMIKAGLTTTSNGELLSSGGMIYINAKGGQQVTIKEAIKVAIPSDFLDPGMQLFKGEQDSTGNINWVQPDSLPENGKLKSIEKGKAIFISQCASCHIVGKQSVGPDLANILKRKYMMMEGGYPGFHSGIQRRYASWLENNPPKWTVGDEGTGAADSNIISKDTAISGHGDMSPASHRHFSAYGCYHCNLRNMFGSTPPSFPDMKWESVQDIYNYIQNESGKRKLPMPSHVWLDDCIDSCRAYTDQVELLLYKKQEAERIKKKLIKENGKLTEENRHFDTTPAAPELPLPPPPSTPSTPNFDETVSPENHEAVYYQFSIETFGWYNVDVLLKSVNGTVESELFVRLTGQYKEKVDIFLIIPGPKIYTKAGKSDKGTDEFAFAYKNGKIFLPQNASAFIMAVTETESSIAFALKKFTTGLKQEFEIELQASTKEVFTEAIRSIGGTGITIQVKDAINADSIRKTNKQIKAIDEELKKAESLKPKNCDCDCGALEKDTVATDKVNKK